MPASWSETPEAPVKRRTRITHKSPPAANERPDPDIPMSEQELLDELEAIIDEDPEALEEKEKKAPGRGCSQCLLQSGKVHHQTG